MSLMKDSNLDLVFMGVNQEYQEQPGDLHESKSGMRSESLDF